jgi:hypothetical protein
MQPQGTGEEAQGFTRRIAGAEEAPNLYVEGRCGIRLRQELELQRDRSDREKDRPFP